MPSPENHLDDHLDRCSSRIKNIYIELPGYEYFHSPSGVSRPDDRFFGRKEIQERLKTIIRNSKTKAGAYLVTGYRGMGKTSLVRRVISQLKYEYEHWKFRKEDWNLVVRGFWFSFVLALVASLIKPAIDFDSTTSFLAQFNMEGIASDGLKKAPWDNSLDHFRLLNISIFMGGAFAFHLFLLWFTWWFNENRKPKLKDDFREFAENLYKWVFPHSRSNPLVQIEISLSQDNIRDLDFLRLLSRKLDIEYRKFRKPFFSYGKTLWKLSIALIGLFGVVFMVEVTIDFIILLFDGLNENPTTSEVLKLGEIKTTVSKHPIQISWRYYFFQLTIKALLFFSYSFLAYYVHRNYFYMLRVFGLNSGRAIANRLESLVARIQTSVTMEKNQGFTPPGGSWLGTLFGRKKTIHYPIATAKEIEFELIDILDDIDLRPRFPFFSSTPTFIFVFDELDKIELDSGQEDTVIESRSGQQFLTRKLRERQKRISNILANLKHFLNVAKAKFIFIAGREMFDASLADVSDRDFFLGSIFHDIIYVESFLKDNAEEKSFGITRMIEHYLCQALMKNRHSQPSNQNEGGETKNQSTLHAYSEKLNSLLKHMDAMKKHSPVHEGKKNCRFLCFLSPLQRLLWKKRKKVKEADLKDSNIEHVRLAQIKVVTILQNFIVYLVYRSNGTPKKITQVFESFIREIEVSSNEINPYRDLVVPCSENSLSEFLFNSNDAEASRKRKRESRFFLVFDYDTQYQLSLIAYLFRPWMISTSQEMKSFGDKLLFSTSYIADHLFKFHSWAFSWRTLELTPEIVFASRSPELREYIGEVMNTLVNNHLREIVYGVFEFRFYNKIRQEIDYISKIKEVDSAAFNFTLDESLQIKQYFQNRLNDLIRQYKDHPGRQTGDYYHALAYLHSTLGDLNYYDQEYDEALIEYSEALAITSRNFLPDHSTPNFTPHQLTNWMKDRLKLGLTYEKMRANDDAYAKYEGLLVDLELFFDIESDSDGISPESKLRARFAKSLFENLRFFQLPFVAKLVLIEKEGISGISYMDIVGAEDRMRNFLRRCLEFSGFSDVRKRETQEFLVRTYYHLNVGSVLFFKNGAALHALDELHEEDRQILEAWNRQFPYLMGEKPRKGKIDPDKNVVTFPRGALIEYYKAFLFIFSRIQAFDKKRTPIVKDEPDPRPIQIHKDGLKWVSNLTFDPQNSFPQWIKELLYEEKKKLFCLASPKKSFFPIGLVAMLGAWFFNQKPYEVRYIAKDKNLLSTMALLYGKMADTMLQMVHFAVPFEYEKWESLFEMRDVIIGKERKGKGSKGQSLGITNSFYWPVILNLIAAEYSQKAGLHFNVEFYLRKILYIIREYLSIGIEGELGNGKEEFLKLIKKKVLTPALKAISRAGKMTNRPQIFKFKDILDIHGSTDSFESRNLYNSLSNGPETRELAMLMVSIELILDPDKYYEGILKGKDLFSKTVHPYSNYSTKFVRLHELGIRSQINFGYLFRNKQNKSSGNQSASSLHKFAYKLVLNYLAEECLGESGVDTSSKGPWNFIKHFRKDLAKEDFTKDLKALEDIKPKDGVQEKEQSQKQKQYEELGRFFSSLNDVEINRFEDLLVESLFCLVDQMKTLRIFGSSYMINHTYLSNVHKRLGDWSLLYKGYLRFLRVIERISPKSESENGIANFQNRLKSFQSNVKAIVEVVHSSYLEPKYHYENSLRCAYVAIQLHTNGKEYYKQLQNMYFLEDDFNDGMYHFTAAVERYKINIGDVKLKIEQLKWICSTSKTFDFEAYVNDYSIDGVSKPKEASPP